MCEDRPRKKSKKFSRFLLTVFTVILHNSLAQRDEVLPSTVSTRCLARFDATRNVDCSLPQSTRGKSRVTVRVLVARSHHNGEEEEEGCQEGRQEEEGPRLNLTSGIRLGIRLMVRLGESLRRRFDAGIPFGVRWVALCGLRPFALASRIWGFASWCG